MQNTLARLAAAIDRISAVVGRMAIWCSLYIVVAEFAVAAMRYLLGLGSIRLQESVIYAHAALFMLASTSASFRSCSFSSPCCRRYGSRRGLRPGCRIGFMGRD